MSLLSNYQREERTIVEASLRCKIVEAKEAVSKAGNQMLVIAVRPSGVRQVVNHYVVCNEYFNRNVTDVFDAFPSLDGTTELDKWSGAMGAAVFSTDIHGYIRVDCWIPSDLALLLPPYEESETAASE